MNILEMLSFPFMQRALIAGVLVSLCAALLGVSLVLKRYSMIGDGLSHVSFGALAIAVALGVTPLYFSIPVVILAAFFLLRMASHPRWNSDAAVAVMSASALAVGVIVISRTTGMTTDVDNYMFGSVLAMTEADVLLSAGLCLAVLVLFVLFYHKLFAVTFDESFSRATGLRVDWYNTLLAVLTALTIVLGMRMMGAMLISSLVIFPALTAMRLFKSFRGVMICAGITAVVCFCAGLTASWVWSTPVGACFLWLFTWSGQLSRKLRARLKAYTPMSRRAPPARFRLKKRFCISYSLKLPKLIWIICTRPKTPSRCMAQSFLYRGMCQMVMASARITPFSSASDMASLSSLLFKVMDFSHSTCLPFFSASLRKRIWVLWGVVR